MDRQREIMRERKYPGATPAGSGEGEDGLDECYFCEGMAADGDSSVMREPCPECGQQGTAQPEDGERLDGWWIGEYSLKRLRGEPFTGNTAMVFKNKPTRRMRDEFEWRPCTVIVHGVQPDDGERER